MFVGSSAFNGLLLDKNAYGARIEIGPLHLTKGQYSISLRAVDAHGGGPFDDWVDCGVFNIVECSPYGFGHEVSSATEGICTLSHVFTPTKKVVS